MTRDARQYRSWNATVQYELLSHYLSNLAEMDHKSPAYAFSEVVPSEENTSTTENDSRFARIAKHLNVETGGIERVTPEERQHNTTHWWNACTFWFSASEYRCVQRLCLADQFIRFRGCDSFVRLSWTNLWAQLLHQFRHHHCCKPVRMCHPSLDINLRADRVTHDNIFVSQEP